MNMKKIFICLLPALLALSCTTSPDYVVDKGDKGDKVEVCFGQNINIGSRISIGDNGSASWTKGDKIALWAQKSDGSFEMANQTFSLHHFSSTFDTAIFSSLITPLTEQSYTYYATYPVPESVDGNIARFNLPATQNGGRELGVRDIMVARPATGAALTEDEYANLDLGFTHKMHTLRLQLEDTKLNGVDIDYVVLYFPTDVVGDVLVDITDPYATPTFKNTLDYITIIVPDGYTTDDYLWTTIFPTTITGDISYCVIAGEYTSKIQTLSLNKEAKPQRVTPMNMPIPEPVTTIYIAVTDTSNLGEEFHTLSVIDANGNTLATFGRNDMQVYYLTEDLGLTSGQVLTIGYESENAYVTTKVTVPTIQTGKTHRIESVVPYLLFEDGSGIHTNFEKDDERVSSLMSADGVLLDSYMATAGWNGAHIKLVAGQSMRVNVRHQSTFGVTRSNGRLDTPTMNGIKAGKSVKLQIWFDMGAYANSGYSSANDIFCVSGVHTKSGAINGVTTTAVFSNVADDNSRVSGQFSTIGLKTDYLGNKFTNDSFNATFPTFTYTITDCTSATRFCWIPCCVQSTWRSSNNAHYYIYLDNIKVKIAK